VQAVLNKGNMALSSEAASTQVHLWHMARQHDVAKKTGATRAPVSGSCKQLDTI